MAELGGETYPTERLLRELLRADMCAVATEHCYEHGAKVVDALLARFEVTRKPFKEIA